MIRKQQALAASVLCLAAAAAVALAAWQSM